MKKLLCLYIVGFCNQGVSRSSSCDELKNFATNNLLQLVIEVAYWDLHNWLVMYWSRALKGEIVTTEQVQLGTGVRVQL